MGKGYKGVPCVYCGERPSEDGDHVIARQFFLPERRGNLPKVPSCKQCNNEKSKLEHSLTAVLPLGGRHTDAKRMLTEFLPPRLARNNRLHAALAEGFDGHLVSEGGGPWERGATVPFDGAAMERLLAFIVMGLAWHHWKLGHSPDVAVRAAFLVERGRVAFERLLSLNARERVRESLGEGTFEYEGAMSAEHPDLTVWRMSFYGGATFLGGESPRERLTAAYGLTVPKGWPSAGKIMEMLGD